MNQPALPVKSNVVQFSAPSKPAGFYVTPRSLHQSAAWIAASFVQRHVLNTIISMAAYKPEVQQVGADSIDLAPGDLCITQAALAKNCGSGMTRDMLKRAVQYWVRSEILTCKTVQFQAQRIENAGPELAQNNKNRISVISLCNYGSYTASGATEKTEQAQSRPREPEAQAHSLRSKDLKELKTLNTCANPVENTTDSHDVCNSPEPVMFDQFWSEYPRKTNKAKAKATWLKIKSPELRKQIIEHVSKRKSADPQWSKDAGKFVPHATTFLNGKRWEDEYEEESSGFPAERAKRIAAKITREGIHCTQAEHEGKSYWIFADGRVKS